MAAFQDPSIVSQFTLPHPEVFNTVDTTSACWQQTSCILTKEESYFHLWALQAAMGKVGEHFVDFGVVWLFLWLSYVVNLHATDIVFLAEPICKLNHMVLGSV